VDLNGSYAEYCIVEAADLYRKPTSLSMEDAASVPYACLAAYAALAHVGRLADKRKQADKSVLVLGPPPPNTLDTHTHIPWTSSQDALHAHNAHIHTHTHTHRSSETLGRYMQAPSCKGR